MADNLVYEESLNTEVHTSEFISKKWVYVNDNNNGNYSSQVVIDSTPLSNAGGYISYQEGFIIMPLLVQLTSNDPASLPVGTNTANFSWAFKSGFWHIINSMTVEFNNQNIIQQTPFLNVFTSFKANTSFSLDDLYNVGPTTGFYPDNAGSWHYNSVGTDDVLNILNADCENYPYTNNTNASYNASYPSTTEFIDLDGNSQLYSQLPLTGVAGVPSFTAGANDTNVVVYGGASSNSVFHAKSA